MTMTIIPANKLNAQINSVVKAGAKFSGQLHTVAYSCLALIETSGDVRPLQRLYDLIGGRVTKGAIAAWAKAFGKVTIAYAEEDTAKERPVFKYAKGGKSDMEGAAACPVLDFKPAPAAKKEFDLATRLASLLKAAEEAGCHLAAETDKAYTLLVEAETVLNGGNVVTFTTSKAGKAKNAAKAKAAKAEAAAACS